MALSLSLFRFEKPPAPSQLDIVTTSEDLFFGALPPPIGSLCVLPRPFTSGLFEHLRSKLAIIQFCLKHSEIKLRSRSLIQSFSPLEKKTSGHRVNNSCHRINNSKPGGFHHSSPLCVVLRHSHPRLWNTSVVVAAIPPQGLQACFGA